MKYKVVVSIGSIVEPTTMIENCSALAALNMVLDCMKSRLVGEHYVIAVFYLTKDGSWKLENKSEIR